MTTFAKVARSRASVVQTDGGRFGHGYGYKKTDGGQPPAEVVMVSGLWRRTSLTRLKDGHKAGSTSTHDVWKRLEAPAADFPPPPFVVRQTGNRMLAMLFTFIFGRKIDSMTRMLVRTIRIIYCQKFVILFSVPPSSRKIKKRGKITGSCWNTSK